MKNFHSLSDLTTIAIKRRTKTKLESIGKKGDSFDDLITRLLKSGEVEE